MASCVSISIRCVRLVDAVVPMIYWTSCITVCVSWCDRFAVRLALCISALPSPSFRFECLHFCPDVLRSFFYLFMGSSSLSDTSDTFALPVVSMSSQLKYALHSPSSLTFRDSFHCCAGSSSSSDGTGMPSSFIVVRSVVSSTVVDRSLSPLQLTCFLASFHALPQFTLLRALPQPRLRVPASAHLCRTLPLRPITISPPISTLVSVQSLNLTPTSPFRVWILSASSGVDCLRR